jgi:hypothetical protein
VRGSIFENEMRPGPCVDSRKFDIPLRQQVRATSRSDVGEPLRQIQNPQFGRLGKARLPYPQLIDQIVRRGMKTVRD